MGKRCVNLDWLEVYVLESRHRYPCDADYFRKQGYFVKERDYGTRSYNQMFTIEDEHGDPWIEVRRDPQSGNSDFVGLVPESCHLRLVNRACYADDAVEKLRQFMMKHDYLFQRIFRIDVCYDFEFFDYGDDPEKFARRYINRVYRKVNQAKLSSVANDNWGDFEWESLSWGNPKSMVSTKMYNKTKELARPKADKPYIRYSWWLCGLIDDPINGTKKNVKGEVYHPNIWRVEFSMKSSARNWLIIEDITKKKKPLTKIPHTLSMFDSKDKLWQRFQDLAFHYFHFKIMQYKVRKPAVTAAALQQVSTQTERQAERKDRCPDKKLFRWDMNHQFSKLEQLPKASKPSRDDDILRRRLERYKLEHLSPRITEACDTILDSLTRSQVARLSEVNDPILISLLQRAIDLKLKHPDWDISYIFNLLHRENYDTTEFFA